MARQVAVSFEDSAIRVVFALSKGKHIEIKDALTLRDDQLDDFLLNEKTKEFVVANSFKDFFQDIIHVPPAHKGYLKKLIAAELKKRAPFKDFSFIHCELGEKLFENRRMKEVFVFAVKNEEVRNIVNRFVSRGKVVRAIYSDIFSIASQIDSRDLPVICISEAGFNKNLSLIKDGRIQFIRTAQSLERGISDLDIQNINMTVNYCRQALRISPSHIMLSGSLCSNYNTASNATIPIACLAKQPGPFLDFVSPVSALSVSADRSLLSKEFRNFFHLRKFLRYSGFLFLTASIIGMGYAGGAIKTVIGLKNKISSVRTELPDLNSMLTAYDNKMAQTKEYMPFVSSLNNAASNPDVKRFLSLLSGLSMDNIIIDSISVTADNKILKVDIKGNVRTPDYAGMQAHYQRFIDSFSSRGLNIKSQKIDLKDKRFHIELEHK